MIADNLQQIQQRMLAALEKAGRRPDSAQLLAVSKTFPNEAVKEAYDAGQRHFGENKVQELLVKGPGLPQDITWHLIGHLQQNKVRQALRYATWIHSVDSSELFERINRISTEMGATPSILLEINISGEESKFGLAPDKAEEVLSRNLNGPATCVGLMTVAPADASEMRLHDIFASLRELRDNLQAHLNIRLPELSMGMSGDFEIALAEGATIIRVGSAIFGNRHYL